MILVNKFSLLRKPILKIYFMIIYYLIFNFVYSFINFSESSFSNYLDLIKYFFKSSRFKLITLNVDRIFFLLLNVSIFNL